MHKSPTTDASIAFQIAFADIGSQWQSNSEASFFFNRHLRYAESIPSALVEAARNIFGRVDVGQRPEFPSMSFGLVESVMFNCFARRELAHDRYHAGMSVAVPLATLELACYYFSYPQLFPNIGDPQGMPMVRIDANKHPPMFQLLDGKLFASFRKGVGETKAANMESSISNAMRLANAVRLNDPQLSGTNYFKYFDSVLEFMLPECPVRRMHCEYMSYALIHYLWIHEISHITNGHLIELRQRTGQVEANFNEFFLGQFASSPLSGNIDCLAMEFDADIEAATVMLGLIMGDIDIESDEEPFVSRLERVTLFIFGLVAFYTSVAARELASKCSDTHPPALLRLENILIHMAGMVQQQGKLQQAILSGHQMFQSYWQQKQHPWLPPTALDSAERVSIGKGKWWEIYRHRQEISTGYDKHRLGNLRVFMSSFDKELRGSPLFSLGPEPDWWEKGN